MSKEFPTHIVMIREERHSEHYTLMRKEALTDDDVWEKTVKAESWPDGVIDMYVRKKGD
jgi:hypothetical protein